jgi:phage-related holin
MDLIMGIVASRKLGEKIESKKLKNTLVKMVVYQLLIISAFISEKYMVDFIPLTKITLAFVAIVEFTSLAENFQKITGLPFVKYIAKYINNMLNKEDLPKIDKDGEDK